MKADAARRSYAAAGAKITWAVIDSGIDRNHPHFKTYDTLDVDGRGDAARLHRDFTLPDTLPGEQRRRSRDAPRDRRRDRRLRPRHARRGHHRRVAGAPTATCPPVPPRRQATSSRAEHADSGLARPEPATVEHDRASPAWRRVQARQPQGARRRRGTTLEQRDPRPALRPRGAQRRRQDPCASTASTSASATSSTPSGSPAARARSASRSTGWCGPAWSSSSPRATPATATLTAAQRRRRSRHCRLTINDPGNAELAITVGVDAPRHRRTPTASRTSRPRARPATAGSSPTSSRRASASSPAPPASAARRCARDRRAARRHCDYIDDSGTSMAAPHVSGAIAAFLSIRREFIGQPEEVKHIFLASATDLGRERVLPGQRARRPDARDPVGLTTGRRHRRERGRSSDGRLHGFPYWQVEFNEDGAVVDGRRATTPARGRATLTDLFVISHGWNNDVDDRARPLYRRLPEQRCHRWRGRGNRGANYRHGVGVIWPSMRWADETPPACAAGQQPSPLRRRRRMTS